MLGLKVFRLGSTVVSRFDERQAALPVMERIHDEIGETTFLCVPRGDDAVCIERIDGKQVNVKSLTTRQAVIDELRATRERGYAISDEDFTPGVASIGVPIFDHSGVARASLSIGGLRESILGDGSRAVELARAGAAEISRTLGHDGTRPG